MKKLNVFIFLTIVSVFFFHHYYNDFNQLIQNINNLFTCYSNNIDIHDSKKYFWTKNFRNNIGNIVMEYNNFISSKNKIPYYKQINNQVTFCDVNNKWKSLYLRIFTLDTKNTYYFPNTMKIINKCYPKCVLAFFSLLEPGAYLTPHIGIYGGVLRYHLSLKIPQDSDNCFIVINNKKISWKINEDIMFDDMFNHYVQNNTNEERLVLFLDIRKIFNNFIIDFINILAIQYIKTNDSVQETLFNIDNF